jgi:hypothetical protein
MRARIASSSHPADLGGVALGGAYHAYGNRLYNNAIADLTRAGGPTVPGVIAARDAVLGHWNNALPADAGRYYYHWWDNSTSERCFAASTLATADAKERECAWRWARHEGWVEAGSAHRWLKRIRSAGGGRLGSMYIFR